MLARSLHRPIRSACRCQQYIQTVFQAYSAYSMATSEVPAKRPATGKAPKSKHAKIRRTKRDRNIRAGAASIDVLQADIRSLLNTGKYGDDSSLAHQEGEDDDEAPTLWTEVQVEIEALSATGDGIGRVTRDSKHPILVPFTAPGDLVKAKIYQSLIDPVPHSKADLVEVLKQSPHRDDSLIKCRYFGTCAGCSFQMLPYSYQMEYKQSVVVKAYRDISGLPSDLVPKVNKTLESPKQYGYRTKVTPHFDGLPWARRKKGDKPRPDEVPPIGFMMKQRPKTMDIEECPLATEACLKGLTQERARVAREIHKYPRGATLLIRETTERLPKNEDGALSPDPMAVIEDHGDFMYVKTAVTDPKAAFTEWIDDFQIRNVANSFFQNNSSILSLFIEYVRSQVQPQPHQLIHHTHPGSGKLNNLIDAYCGSGLFSITLSSLFDRTIGIDIDAAAIAQAEKNAQTNSSLEQTTTHNSPKFIAADANELFASVKNFNSSETVVILDPPRKGCDENFLRQLLDFAPQRIVYVSCNVHTQASDIGWLLGGHRTQQSQPETETEISIPEKSGGDQDNEKPPKSEYTIESIQPFDFFPQTYHVESVAVLVRSAHVPDSQ